MRHLDRWLAPAAAALAACAYAVLAALLEGYSHLLHPVALPGAIGVPRAWAFNLLVFVLPGLLLAVSAWRIRDRLPAAAGTASVADRGGAASFTIQTPARTARRRARGVPHRRIARCSARGRPS